MSGKYQFSIKISACGRDYDSTIWVKPDPFCRSMCEGEKKALQKMASESVGEICDDIMRREKESKKSG